MYTDGWYCRSATNMESLDNCGMDTYNGSFSKPHI